MSGINRPFAEPDTKQALRLLLPPKQRAEFDRLQADAARGPKGLARLNWQPPKKQEPIVVQTSATLDDDALPHLNVNTVEPVDPLMGMAWEFDPTNGRPESPADAQEAA